MVDINSGILTIIVDLCGDNEYGTRSSDFRAYFAYKLDY